MTYDQSINDWHAAYFGATIETELLPLKEKILAILPG